MQRMAKPYDPANDRLRENLARFITESGYTPNTVADLANIPQANLRRYMKGENSIPASILPALAEVFGRQPGDFYAANPPPADIENASPVLFRSRPGIDLSDEEWKKIEDLKADLVSRRKKKKR